MSAQLIEHMMACSKTVLFQKYNHIYTGFLVIIERATKLLVLS